MTNAREGWLTEKALKKVYFRRDTGYMTTTDDIDSLCRMALAALEQEWRPIETAPKDGTWVLLGSNGTDSSSGTWVTQGYFYDEGWRGETTDDGAPGYCVLHDSQPTHWLPLPTPPKEA